MRITKSFSTGFDTQPNDFLSQISTNPYITRPDKLLPPVAREEDIPINFRKAVAQEVGLSHGTVQNYMQVAKEGTPELLARVQSGEIKIKTARRLLESELIKDIKAAHKLVDDLEEIYPIEGDDEYNAYVKGLLQRLHEPLEQLRRARDETSAMRRP